MGFDEPRETYCEWQRNEVREEQKVFYDQTQHLIVHHGIELDMIVSNKTENVSILHEFGTPRVCMAVCFRYQLVSYISGHSR